MELVLAEIEYELTEIWAQHSKSQRIEKQILKAAVSSILNKPMIGEKRIFDYPLVMGGAYLKKPAYLAMAQMLEIFFDYDIDLLGKQYRGDVVYRDTAFEAATTSTTLLGAITIAEVAYRTLEARHHDDQSYKTDYQFDYHNAFRWAGPAEGSLKTQQIRTASPEESHARFSTQEHIKSVMWLVAQRLNAPEDTALEFPHTYAERQLRAKLPAHSILRRGCEDLDHRQYAFPPREFVMGMEAGIYTVAEMVAPQLESIGDIKDSAFQAALAAFSEEMELHFSQKRPPSGRPKPPPLLKPQ